ncbi:MAG: DUF3604 domain-containing protein [Planctomycetota bacterium]
MTEKNNVSDYRLNRRNFLLALTAGGAVIALSDGRILADSKDRTWPEDVEQFPALACDAENTIWMASVVRPIPDSHIRVDCIKNGRKKRICILQPKGMTGIAAHSIAPLQQGCIVVFPVEKDNQWHIVYAFIHAGTKHRQNCQYLPCKGSSNISPAVVVVNNSAHVVWESNNGEFRGIYTSHINRGSVGPVQRLSSPRANSYNPSIVALPNGSIFTAWDSIRNYGSNIYGSWFKDGQWLTESKITNGRRIERHPFLTSWKNNIWMAWQAQTYKERCLNNLIEQRIVVACLTDKGLQMPIGLFQKVSTSNRLLMRPRIAFDPDGHLWLTASLGMKNLQAGWRPVIWQYSDRQWSEMQFLSNEQSRWQPIPMVFPTDTLASIAVQSDDLPQGWDNTRGKYRDWKSKVTIKRRNIDTINGLDRIEMHPLKMPETKFSLREKIELCSAELPRQQWKHGKHKLTLFWGDFHDHTDLSVCNRRHNPSGHDLFANLRDIEKLDFCALTDHGYNFDPQQWSLNGEQTRYNYDSQRFLTFLGQEWTSSKNYTSGGYGHRNLIFLDPYHNKFYDSYDGKISPYDLWNELKGVEFICIPHQLADWQHKGKGNPPTDWSFVDEKLQPVAEIFQHRESYEYLGCPRQAPHGEPKPGNYLQDAWAKGIIIGVIASPDHGGGKGKAGVWARELTREKIFKAIRARHTFGTSGAKMALRFSTDEAMMGDKVIRQDGPISFTIAALAMNDIVELVIFRNNEIVHKTSPNSCRCTVKWTDKHPLKTDRVWYYTRIRCSDKELAWSSPIWFLT